MSSGDMPPPIAASAGYLLKRAQHALRTRMDDELRPLELTAPQYAVLAAIELQPGISNAALARAAFVSAQTMQGIVANLEAKGLLSRRPDPDHGRILRTELTESGAALLASAHDIADRAEGAMLGGFSAAETRQLTDLLARCVDGLVAAED